MFEKLIPFISIEILNFLKKFFGSLILNKNSLIRVFIIPTSSERQVNAFGQSPYLHEAIVQL